MRCSQVLHAGSNPVLRQISPEVSGSSTCLPLMTLNKDQTTFGRHPNNDFLMDSSTLKNFFSRWHCKVESFQTTDGEIAYRIFDFSLNGTFVNDYRIYKQGCVLKNGDTVAFGHLNGANIKEGTFAPQPNPSFQYVFQYENKPSQVAMRMNYKHVWSSPCCKKGKKCSAIHKKLSKSLRTISKLTKSKHYSLLRNSHDTTKNYGEESFQEKQQQTQLTSETSSSQDNEFGFSKLCDSSDNSDGSDGSLLEKVKMSVENFGASDSDVLDSSGSPNKVLL
ncbi:hypothetical protein Ahia01_001387200 [Argonauta hians]